MYIYVYIYLHTDTSKNVHTSAHTYIHMCIHLSIYTYLHTCIWFPRLVRPVSFSFPITFVQGEQFTSELSWGEQLSSVTCLVAAVILRQARKRYFPWTHSVTSLMDRYFGLVPCDAVQGTVELLLLWLKILLHTHVCTYVDSLLVSVGSFCILQCSHILSLLT